jgi:hypothetical protein
VRKTVISENAKAVMVWIEPELLAKVDAMVHAPDSKYQGRREVVVEVLTAYFTKLPVPRLMKAQRRVA